MQAATRADRNRFLGISWDKRDQRWRARISIAGRSRCLGYFKTEKEARSAYESAALKTPDGRCKPPNAHSEIAPGVIAISLTQGRFALIDAADWELVSNYRWHAYRGQKTFYARSKVTSQDGSVTVMGIHQIICKCEPGFEPDHLDGDGLNNRRTNLVAKTHRGNLQNRHDAKSSQYPGVSWHKASGKWQALIRVGTKRLHLGLFQNEKEAWVAYSSKCKELTRGSVAA
jgi:hypothetical protein